MDLVEYAKNELRLCKNSSEYFQQQLDNNIISIIELFEKQGHLTWVRLGLPTSSTASYTIARLIRLLDFKPLTPLTGDENEWQPCMSGETEQNKRCFSVFRKNKDNKTAYYNNAKVFSNTNSIVNITFPFTVPDEPERILLKKESD